MVRRSATGSGALPGARTVLVRRRLRTTSTAEVSPKQGWTVLACGQSLAGRVSSIKQKRRSRASNSQSNRMIPANARVLPPTLPGDALDDGASGAVLCRVGVDGQVG